MAGAKEGLKRLLEANDVVIFTVKPAPLVEAWMKYWGFPPLRVTSTKEDCDLFIDDKAYRFTTWADLWESTLVRGQS